MTQDDARKALETWLQDQHDYHAGSFATRDPVMQKHIEFLKTSIDLVRAVSREALTVQGLINSARYTDPIGDQENGWNAACDHLEEGLLSLTSPASGNAMREALAEELREYTAMKYAGDCKCGKCQLVPRALVERIYHTLNSSLPADDGAKS